MEHMLQPVHKTNTSSSPNEKHIYIKLYIWNDYFLFEITCSTQNEENSAYILKYDEVTKKKKLQKRSLLQHYKERTQ